VASCGVSPKYPRGSHLASASSASPHLYPDLIAQTGVTSYRHGPKPGWQWVADGNWSIYVSSTVPVDMR
jgi:hypothetical protein